MVGQYMYYIDYNSTTEYMYPPYYPIRYSCTAAQLHSCVHSYAADALCAPQHEYLSRGTYSRRYLGTCT